MRHIRRRRADVVHVIGAGPQSVYVAALRRFFRARLVFTTGGELTFDPHGVFERSATLRAGLRRMLREADAVTSCSAFSLRDLHAFAPVNGPAFVVPNGVNPSDFACQNPGAEDIGRYVLAVGRLVPQKGFDLLIEAFASDALSGLNLAIAGDGFQRDALETRAVELGIASRVRFLGSVDRGRLPRLLQGASVFAFPSRGEPFGIALLEAMAAGVPAVAAAAGGVPEFVLDGQNGILVEPEDVQGLVSAIARVNENRDLRERLVLGGRQTAEDFAWRNIAERYESIFRDVLDGDASARG